MNILRRRRKSKKKFNAHKFSVIIFFLMMTTFAWFTYYKVLNVELDIHMASWDVEFLLDDERQSDLLEINVPTLYPGMDDQVYDIKVKNNGELTVDLFYYIEKLEIIGNEYDILQTGDTTTNDYYITIGQISQSNNISYQNVINDTTKFPFTIDIENTALIGSGEEGYIKLKISWDGTNDELDSKWGHDVGKYFMENETQATEVVTEGSEETGETESTETELPIMKLLIRIDVTQATI